MCDKQTSDILEKYFLFMQPEVLMDIEVEKPSLYLIIYHYVNRGNKTIEAQVMIRSEYEDTCTCYYVCTLTYLLITNCLIMCQYF